MSSNNPETDNLTSATTEGLCIYECNGSEWMLVSGNPGPGYYCEPTMGNCNANQAGMRRIEVASPVLPPSAS